MLAQSPENLVLLDKSIMESVDQKLKSEGFTLDAEKPDFYISYEADTMGGISGGGGPAVNPNAGYSAGKVGGIAPSSTISTVAAISFHMWMHKRKNRFGILFEKENSRSKQGIRKAGSDYRGIGGKNVQGFSAEKIACGRPISRNSFPLP